MSYQHYFNYMQAFSAFFPVFIYWSLEKNMPMRNTCYIVEYNTTNDLFLPMLQCLKKHIMCQNLVTLTPCCTKHIARSFWHYGIKALHAQIYKTIKQNNTSNLAQSPIQPTKQGHKKSSRKAGQDGGWTKFLKKGVGKNRSGLHKIGAVSNPLLNMK